MIYVMDMEFKTIEDVPDFGSIRMINKKKFDTYQIREYSLLSEDVSKLDLITNAFSGSTALCVDTAEVYAFNESDKVWYKL